MISNQVLQNTLEGLKEISRTDLCIMDAEGKCLASTFSENVSDFVEVKDFAQSQAESQLIKGRQYFKVSDDHQLDYILMVHGDNEDSYMVGKLAAFQIQSLIVAYKERFDKDSFIKNLLLDNLL
ncbi:MAG: PucR family transcriptional regulator, partial [Lachnospiraceae bacterium]|nr:PucR family transcriptional regulator [Lachnospiraceae bacterium]